MRLCTFVFFLFLPLCLCPSSGSTSLLPDIALHFATVNGSIIMPIANEYLIDFDSSANLQPGDILTLISPGEEVRHPITQEVLGSLDSPAGFLQVTRIESGYSFAKLLSSATPPQVGNPLRRFSHVSSRFVDKQKDGTEIFFDLKKQLPKLNWLDAHNRQKALLLFTLENNKVTVTDTTEKILYSFNLTIATTQNQPKPETAPAGANELTAARQTHESLPPELPAPESNHWKSPQLVGNPVGISIANLTSDGRPMLAIAFDKRLLIIQLQDNHYQEPIEVTVPTELTLLALDSFDLDGDGTAELYITASQNNKLHSFMIEYSNDQFLPSIQNIPWYLRVVDLTEGRVLLGQNQGDKGEVFTGQPFRIHKKGQQLFQGKPLQLPKGVNLFSFCSFISKDGQQLYAYLTENDYLNVSTAEGTLLWKSKNYFGGSETSIPPKQEHNDLAPSYLRSRLRLGPKGEILIAQNDGLRALQRFRLFRKSRLLAMNWTGERLEESWRSPEQDGYLADFAIADIDNDGSAELLMAVKTVHKKNSQQAKTQINRVELK